MVSSVLYGRSVNRLVVLLSVFDVCVLSVILVLDIIYFTEIAESAALNQRVKNSW